MRKKYLLIILWILIPFLAEAALLAAFMRTGRTGGGFLQDTVAVNEIARTVEAHWGDLEELIFQENCPFAYDFAVLDREGNLLWKSAEGLSESINAAISHRDTILDVARDGATVGKVIIHNGSEEDYEARKRNLAMALLLVFLLQAAVLLGYTAWIYYRLIRPFRRLKGFAERVAGGNLDVPLQMDRHNLFGAFTESFDIMRSELRKARLAEAQANAAKKELVAKLSHDIKTPVASIKAASELGLALSDSDRMRDNYTQIIRKADQINTLITDLFTATLEELQQLTVARTDISSGELALLLENADYLHRSQIPPIPSCLLHADRLRLQQVLDNLFANSYKYAGTEIVVAITREKCCLAVLIEDFGGGVPDQELPLLKEKFRRGSNVGDREGAGLGLFISDYFMREMGGDLIVENGAGGLRVRVMIPLSGA